MPADSWHCYPSVTEICGLAEKNKREEIKRKRAFEGEAVWFIENEATRPSSLFP